MSDILEKLSKSKFRSGFGLKSRDRQYVEEKGFDTVEKHARDFISKRIAAACIPNDGKQTPMKGHPVFIAQHATASCCRKCIKKWHKFETGKELTCIQQEYLVGLIMRWIKNQMNG